MGKLGDQNLHGSSFEKRGEGTPKLQNSGGKAGTRRTRLLAYWDREHIIRALLYSVCLYTPPGPRRAADLRWDFQTSATRKWKQKVIVDVDQGEAKEE